MQHWAQETERKKHTTQKANIMSNTDPMKKNPDEPRYSRGETVPLSFKTSAVLLLVKSGKSLSVIEE
jgi:hypothetical protein